MDPRVLHHRCFGPPESPTGGSRKFKCEVGMGGGTSGTTLPVGEDTTELRVLVHSPAIERWVHAMKEEVCLYSESWIDKKATIPVA